MASSLAFANVPSLTPDWAAITNLPDTFTIAFPAAPAESKSESTTVRKQENPIEGTEAPSEPATTITAPSPAQTGKRVKAITFDEISESSSSLQMGLIMILASFGNVFKARMHEASLKNETVEWRPLLEDTVEQMMNSNEIYAGLLGMALSEPVAKIFSIWLTSPALRPIVRGFLATGITTLITIGAWEFFAQLCRESTLDFSAEEKAAMEGLSLRLLSDKLKPGDRALLQKWFASMGNILTGKPELRQLLISNTIRLNYLRGDFITMITALATLTAAGGAATGGSGGAMMGSIIALALMVIIPKSFTENLTVLIQRARAWSGDRTLATNSGSIDALIGAMQTRSEHYANETLGMRWLIDQRQDTRQYIATALLEQYSELASKIEESEDDLAKAKQTLSNNDHSLYAYVLYDHKLLTYDQFRSQVCGDTTCNPQIQIRAIEDANKQIREAKVTLVNLAARILAIYVNEVEYFGKHLSNKNEYHGAALELALDSELRWTCALGLNLRYIFGVMSPEMIEKLNIENEFTQLSQDPKMVKEMKAQVNYIYLRSFRENVFLLHVPNPDHRPITRVNLAAMPNLIGECQEDAQAVKEQLRIAQ
jgi:hypothetical protein